jgi:hypothetical protein
VQARALVVVGRVDAGAALEQQSDLLEVAISRELAQHRRGVGFVELEQTAAADQRLRDLPVPAAHLARVRVG